MDRINMTPEQLLLDDYKNKGVLYINSSICQDIRLHREGQCIIIDCSSSFVEETRKADDWIAHMEFLAKKLLKAGEKLIPMVFLDTEDDCFGVELI